MNPTPLERAIAEAGSGVALAKIAGVTPMAVSYWKVRGIPAHQVLRIESATGVSRCDLRPDLYPIQELCLTVGQKIPAGREGSQGSDSAVNPSSAAQASP